MACSNSLTWRLTQAELYQIKKFWVFSNPVAFVNGEVTVVAVEMRFVSNGKLMKQDTEGPHVNSSGH